MCVHVCECMFRWLFPFIGHMGICTSAGIIRDFAGPYFVSVSPIRVCACVGIWGGGGGDMCCFTVTMHLLFLFLFNEV